MKNDKYIINRCLPKTYPILSLFTTWNPFPPHLWSPCGSKLIRSTPTFYFLLYTLWIVKCHHITFTQWVKIRYRSSRYIGLSISTVLNNFFMYTDPSRHVPHLWSPRESELTIFTSTLIQKNRYHPPLSEGRVCTKPGTWRLSQLGSIVGPTIGQPMHSD